MSHTTMGVKRNEQAREHLKALAAARRRSAHWLVIDQYLQCEKRIEQHNREADAAWEEYQRTGRS